MTSQKETLDQAIQQLKEHFSYENITAKPQFKDLTQAEYENLIQFIEIYGLLTLSIYFRYDTG